MIDIVTKNIEIPLAHAGIGDAIAIKRGKTGESAADFIAIVGKSVQTNHHFDSDDTIGGPNSEYAWYGSVYGREKGGLMIRSFAPTTAKWASTTEGNVSLPLDSTKFANVIANTTSSPGLQRNGKPCYNGIYLCMSVQRMKEQFGSSTSTALNPTCPYTDGTASLMPMSEANFNKDTSNAKTLYGTYENYLAQMLPIMKGSKSDVFSKRCGKQNTKELATNNANNGHYFIAAQYAYGRYVANENFYHWWLPDMYELTVMMSDESYEKCAYVHNIIGGYTNRAATRWSSVRCSATTAWVYHDCGLSSNPYFFGANTVCPVTLIPIE